MNPGKLNKWIDVLKYTLSGYVKRRSIYCAYKYLPRVIYSKNASAVEGAEITIKKCDINRHEALRINGRHYLIANIDDTDRAYLTLSAAAVKLTEFTGKRISASIGELNRPINTEVDIDKFWGVLNEKYINHEQQIPNAELESGLILTTPKAVLLQSGDTIIANMGDEKVEYAVLIAHTADEFINDYEIVKVVDA